MSLQKQLIGVGDAGDWSGFAALLADVYLEGGAPWEALTTLVTTAGARHHHGFKLQPGWNRRIAISAFLPDWRLDAVDHVYFYGYNREPAAPPRVLFLDNLRLLER